MSTTLIVGSEAKKHYRHYGVKRGPMSQEQRRRLSEAMKGKPCWRKGKPYPGLSERQRGPNNPNWRAKAFTKELRRWFSERNTGKNNPMYGKRGPLCPVWKGGITPITDHIRKTAEFIAWRKAVYKRDNFTCQSCHSRISNKLHAHHLKPFAVIVNEHQIATLEQARNCPELWDVNNGLTLCISCHKTTATYAVNIRHKKTSKYIEDWSGENA